MAQDPVNIGTVANDGTGDTLREAFAKLNANDAELYASMGEMEPDTPAELLAKLLTVDGAGSGLDADLLDGQSSAAFATALHTHAMSDVTGLAAALAAKLDASSYTAADVRAKLLTVDGAGSGIDADLLDGQSAAAFAAAVHSHAIADVTGLQAALDGKGDLSSAAAVSVDSELVLYSGTTGKLTKRATGSGLATLAAGVLTLTDPASFAAAAHTHVIADTTGLQAALDAKLPSASYTAADVLAKLLTVDGTGSGLDADLLDGQSAAAFAAASHTHAQSEITGLTDALEDKLDASDYTAANVLSKLLTVDGAGSGLDADTLDGTSSAGFAAASHTHAIADVTGLQASLDAKLASASYTAADVLAKLLTVDGGASGLDADLLDGLSSTAFFQTSAVLRAVDGALGAPAYSFVSDTNSGIYSSAADEITLGTGNARRTVWDASGRVLFGGATASVQVGQTTTTTVQVGAGTGAGFSAARYSADSTPPVFAMGKSRGPGIGQFGLISSGDNLGRIQFAGADGVDLNTTALEIRVSATGTPAADFVPGQIEIHVSSGSSLVESLRINSGGQTLFRDGSAASPSISLLNDADTGLYRIGADQLGVAVAGGLIATFNSSGLGVKRASPNSSFPFAVAGAAGAGAMLLEDTAVADGASPFWWGRSNTGALELGSSNRAGSGTTSTAVRLTLSTAALASTVPVLAPDGSVGACALSFSTDPDCGLYRIGANNIGISVGGANVIDIGASVLALNATTLRLNTTTASTVGAAGAAAALPAQPLGYLTVNVGGTAAKIPYYTA